MQDVEKIAQDILVTEGGFSDDPDDPGGVTRFGVTLKTLIALRRDFTADGQIDRRDLMKMTRAQAVQIYIDEYFYRPKINSLPAVFHPVVFDMSVNAGQWAIRLLQGVLRDFGAQIALDGIIGPQTSQAAHDIAACAPNHIVDAYAIARRNYYLRLADKSPKLRKYARTRAGTKGGWIIRAEKFLSPTYHLSPAEFQTRISSWH